MSTPAETLALEPPQDPLLECLVVLARIAGQPVSAEALRAGLPLPRGRLDLALLPRAAERAGLAARVIRRPLGRLSAAALPAILLLAGGQACVLAALEDASARVIYPDSGAGAKSVPLEELERSYAGTAVFAHPVFRPDERAADAVPASGSSWFWGTLWRYRRDYVEVVLASVLINAFVLASPLFIMNVYDRVVPNNALETLWALAAGVVIVFAFDFALRTLRGYFVDVVGRRADVRLSAALFGHVMGIQLRERPASAGSFANNLREFESVREFFTSATLATLIDLPFAFLLLWFIGIIGGPLLWVPLLAMAPVVVVGLLIQIPLNRAVGEAFSVGAQKHGFLTEALENIEVVKALGAEGQMQRRWEQAVEHTARAGLVARQYSAFGVHFTLLVQQLVTVLIIIYGVFLIAEGRLTMGGLIACSILAGRALVPLAQIAGLLSRYQHARTALKTLDRVMRMPVERPSGRAFVSRPALRGDIEFDRVSFAYPGQKANVLEGLSLRIGAGERAAILGRVGSGKSSLARLLVGFYAPQQGTLLIDGTDIAQIDPADLRRNIAYVPQDPKLFLGTLRDNITLGRWEVPDEAVMRAAALAGVDRFAARHPAGFAMPVGEGGRALSGGQRQAVASARAFLGSPPILLLDEPTSAMDFATERAYVDAVRQVLEGRTLILITHKPTMLGLVDRIIVIEGGKLAADGPRDKVLQLLVGGAPAREARPPQQQP